MSLLPLYFVHHALRVLLWFSSLLVCSVCTFPVLLHSRTLPDLHPFSLPSQDAFHNEESRGGLLRSERILDDTEYEGRMALLSQMYITAQTPEEKESIQVRENAHVLWGSLFASTLSVHSISVCVFLVD